MEKRKEKKGNLQHVIKETERVNGGLSLRGEWKQITIENNKRTGFVQLSTLSSQTILTKILSLIRGN